MTSNSIVVPKPVPQPAISFWQVVIYLVTYAGRGLAAPFISLYLLSVGYTPVEIGWLVGISALVRLLVVPAYSTWIDRRGEHRKLLSAQFIVTGVSALAMIVWTNKIWMGAMFMARDSVEISSAALMGQLSIISFRERGSAMYGKLRAMGSLGWAMASVMGGTLIGMGGYGLLIALSGLAYLIMLPLVKIFPERAALLNSRLDKPPKRLNAFWLVMASNLLFYIGMNAISVFMYVYFREYLGADDGMVGLFAACFGLFEVPWMIGMSRIYRRISARTALTIGIAGQAVFALCLSLLTGPNLMIPLIAMRGLFYALQNISLTLIVTEISHPANAATNQAITWVTMPALAALITGPIAGWMYEYNPHLLFQLSALVTVFGALLLIVGRGMIDRARASRLPLHVN